MTALELIAHFATWVNQTMKPTDPDLPGFTAFVLDRINEGADYLVRHSISWPDLLTCYIRDKATGG